MTHEHDSMSALRGVIRIAKAASVGVTGNAPRIAAAEAAVAAVAELIEAGKEYAEHSEVIGPQRLVAALARVQGGRPS